MTAHPNTHGATPGGFCRGPAPTPKACDPGSVRTAFIGKSREAAPHHACPICGGLARPSPASSAHRFHCVECDTPLILPAHSFVRDFAGAVMRGRPKPYPKSARVAGGVL